MRFFILFVTTVISLSSLGQTTALPDSLREIQINKMRASFQTVELLNLSPKEKSDLQYAEVKEYTKDHPKDPLFILWGKYFDTVQLDTLYSLIDSSTRIEMRSAIEHQKIRAGLMPEMPFPDLVLKDTSNNQLRISSLKGKVVFINVWASWCKPCREEIPQLIDLHEQYKDRGFVVIAISLDDDKAKWLSAIKKDGQPWAQFCELKDVRNNLMLTKWGISGIPYNFLIDREGKLADKEIGISVLGNKIRRLL